MSTRVSSGTSIHHRIDKRYMSKSWATRVANAVQRDREAMVVLLVRDGPTVHSKVVCIRRQVALLTYAHVSYHFEQVKSSVYTLPGCPRASTLRRRRYWWWWWWCFDDRSSWPRSRLFAKAPKSTTSLWNGTPSARTRFGRRRRWFGR